MVVFGLKKTRKVSNFLIGSQLSKLPKGNYLIKNGIEVRSGFWPLKNTPAVIKKYVAKTNKNFSTKLFEKIIVLPSNINLKKKDIRNIRKIIDLFLNKI